MNTQILIDGVIIPKYSDIQEIIEPNETDIKTLSGHRYTDFRSQLRSWNITYKNLTKSDFDILRELYLKQYSEFRYINFRFDEMGINVQAKMEVSDVNWKYNANIIQNFTVKILEQNPFS